jgi:DNA-binding transcriptional LysR family regulator
VIVSLTKLRQLVAIARCQSFSRAAAELHISQPALSRTVAFIEDVYGTRIFDRTRQGLVVTQSGATIVAEAQRLLRMADAFDHNASMAGGGKLGQVSFGMGPILANSLMADTGIALLADRRQISFEAQTRRADYLIKALLDGDLELGLVGNAHLDIPDEIEVRPIGVVKTAVIARAGHPLAGQANVSLAQLREFPIASPVDLNRLPPFRPVPHNIACDDYGAMEEMVKATDTVCVCAAIFAREACASGEVVTLDVDLPLESRTVDVIAMTLKGRTTSIAVELAIECCREVLESAG